MYNTKHLEFTTKLVVFHRHNQRIVHLSLTQTVQRIHIITLESIILLPYMAGMVPAT